MTGESARDEPGFAGTEGPASEASTASVATKELGLFGTEDSASAASTASVACLRVERGAATPEEIAALVAVLSALGGGDMRAPAPVRSAWSDPSWRLVGPSASRGGWRTSALPR